MLLIATLLYVKSAVPPHTLPPHQLLRYGSIMIFKLKILIDLYRIHGPALTYKDMKTWGQPKLGIKPQHFFLAWREGYPLSPSHCIYICEFSDLPHSFGSSLLAHYWLIIGSLLAHYWLTIGSLLAHYWLTTGSLLAQYWLSIGSLLAHYWLALHVMGGHIETLKANAQCECESNNMRGGLRGMVPFPPSKG